MRDIKESSMGDVTDIRETSVEDTVREMSGTPAAAERKARDSH